MANKELVPESSEGKRNVPARRMRDPFYALQREFDTMFDRFFRRGMLEPFTGESTGMFVPDVDVVETDKEVNVRAEIPGVDEKDVEVTLSGDNLIIKGEKKEEKEQNVQGYYCSERSYGSFMRSIPIPAEVDRDKIEAKFKNGVLDVTLPKTKAAVEGAKKIPIQH